MLITLVAVLCQISSGICLEKIIIDSEAAPNLTMMGCQVGGQAGIAEWMAARADYRSGWQLERFKCALGRYRVRERT